MHYLGSERLRDIGAADYCIFVVAAAFNSAMIAAWNAYQA